MNSRHTAVIKYKWFRTKIQLMRDSQQVAILGGDPVKKWVYRFPPSKLWFYGGKFERSAIIQASKHFSEIMSKIDWTLHK